MDLWSHCQPAFESYQELGRTLSLSVPLIPYLGKMGMIMAVTSKSSKDQVGVEERSVKYIGHTPHVFTIVLCVCIRVHTHLYDYTSTLIRSEWGYIKLPMGESG